MRSCGDAKVQREMLSRNVALNTIAVGTCAAFDRLYLFTFLHVCQVGLGRWNATPIFWTSSTLFNALANPSHRKNYGSQHPHRTSPQGRLCCELSAAAFLMSSTLLTVLGAVHFRGLPALSIWLYISGQRHSGQEDAESTSLHRRDSHGYQLICT